MNTAEPILRIPVRSGQVEIGPTYTFLGRFL